MHFIFGTEKRIKRVFGAKWYRFIYKLKHFDKKTII